MAYDRYDRDERSRWSDDRSDRSFRGDHRDRDERGFWDRASDEVASWFGDDSAERRRDRDRSREESHGNREHSREHGAFGRGWGGGPGRDYDRGYGRDYDRDRARDQNRDRGLFNRGGSSERDYNRDWRGDFEGSREHGRDYRPMAGDYGRSDHESDQFFAASGYGRSDYGRRESGRDRDFDPHYRNWRDRHMSDLDHDYDDYRRENQSRFESDFGSWREKRQHKRGLLGRIREHMDVVGSDDEHIGTVDCTRGDRLVLTKSDPESGGVHHSLSCSDIDRVEGDKVILDCKADEAKNRWRDESRDRALFERDDQGEMGPRNLNRSFEGTYR